MAAPARAREPLRASAALLAFNPSESDLIRYLQRKIRYGGNHPGCAPSSLVPEINVYGDLNPWEMFDGSAGDHWFYAFARLKQRGPTRFHRSVGRGSWTLKNTHKTNDGTNVKRFFIYEERADADPAALEGDNGHWTMHEFSLPGAKDNDYVICRVKNRRQKRTLLAENGNYNHNNLIDLLPADDEVADDWEAILEEEMEEESDGEAAAAAESMVVESSSEPVKIGDFDLESESEVLAMVENFWAEPPSDMGEILGSSWLTTTTATAFPVADRREFTSTFLA